ncbi:hypothetical protein EDC04DRAFT_2897620 [Pisolithus marmoratus]|nr:hypothetical protein EDC04DRAFT_2897620 [Pisolithus marmoratus]
MPRSCKECGLEFDNKNIHDAHWKKCVKTMSFVSHTGQEVTVNHHANGTFLCYCSHPKCPKEVGFATVDALGKHMKNLKTTWLGAEKKASAEGGAEPSGQNPALEIDVGDPHMSAGTIHTPKMPAGMVQDETMRSPSLTGHDDASMKSPRAGIEACKVSSS